MSMCCYLTDPWVRRGQTRLLWGKPRTTKLRVNSSISQELRQVIEGWLLTIKNRSRRDMDKLVRRVLQNPDSFLYSQYPTILRCVCDKFHHDNRPNVEGTDFISWMFQEVTRKWHTWFPLEWYWQVINHVCLSDICSIGVHTWKGLGRLEHLVFT